MPSISRFISWNNLSIFFIILGISLIRASKIPEVDVLWAARNGKDILNGGSITNPADEWNFLTLGETWSPNSWLWNTITYLFSSIGEIGFWLLVFLSNIIIYLLISLFLKNSPIPKNYHPFVLLFSSILLIFFANGRANTADIIISLLYMNLLSASIKFNKKAFVIVTLIGALIGSSLWTNLHLTGVISIPLFALMFWVIESSRKEEAKAFTKIEKRFIFSLIVPISFVGTLISPFGITTYDKIFLVKDESTDLITEWGPIIQPGETLWLHLFIVSIAIVLALVFFIKSHFILLPLALLATSFVTIFISRYALFLSIIIILSIYVIFHYETVKKELVNVLSVLLSSLTLIMGMILTIILIINPSSIYPVPVSDFKNIPSDSRVLTTQHAGSELIYYRPDVLVSMDGRNDLIGKGRMIEVYELFREQDAEVLNSWLKKYKVDVVFIDRKEYEYSDTLIDNLKYLGWDLVKSESSFIFTSPGDL